MRLRLAMLLIVASTASAWSLSTATASAPAYRVIVHPDNRVMSVSQDFLINAFLKRVTRWPDGEVIRPADLGPRARAREEFSISILLRPLAAVRSYWQQQIFAGRNTPPPELASDEAVIEYVVRHRGAIGYVSGSTPTDRVHVVDVR